MTTLFCVRPATRNIGNDLIHRGVADLLYSCFGPDTAIVNIPALTGGHYGGLTAAQVYDMNRLADGVVIGGGNLFENGQLTVDGRAVEALSVPMMIMGVSHARIYGGDYSLIPRTDSLPADSIRQLLRKSSATLVRDHASLAILRGMGLDGVEVGGCPSLFLAPNPMDHVSGDRILVSIRHPASMNVPPPLQWRVAEDVRRMIGALRECGGSVHLLCHDYKDIAFARAFPEAPLIYVDDVDRYLAALRNCRLNVSYRLHAFLPCLAFGTPSVHVSYDERGKSMLTSVGMGDWDVDMAREPDVVAAVLSRAGDTDRFHRLRSAAHTHIDRMRATTLAALSHFAAQVGASPRRALSAGGVI